MKALAFLILGTVAIGDVRAQTIVRAPRTTFGEPGILDMPSARMAADGELGFTASTMRGNQRFNLTFQALSWLEGSFRYRRLAGGYDRSFGLRVRLFEETYYFPELTVGLRDAVGTSLDGAEYIAATKRFGNIDFTTGLGWGRLGSSGALKNPFRVFSSSFNRRSGQAAATAGDVDFRQFFHGPDTGIFAGLAWKTPIEDLNLLVEYSSDRYLRETDAGVLRPRSQINAGLSYRLFDGVALTGGWLYGTSFGATLTLSADPTKTSFDQRLGMPPPLPFIRPPEARRRALTALADQIAAGPEPDDTGVGDFDLTPGVPAPVPVSQLPAQRVFALASPAGGLGVLARPANAGVPDGPTSAAVEQTVRRAAAEQSLRVEAVRIGSYEAVVYFSNGQYQFEAEAVGRLSRVLMANTPPNIELFRFVSIQNGVTAQEVRFSRSSLERTLQFYGGTGEFASTAGVRAAAPANPILAQDRAGTYPRFQWSLSPQVRQTLFDPNQPIQFQFLALLSTSVELTPGFSLIADLEANVADDYRYDRPSDSQLPHVRSDAALYNQNGINGIAQLSTVYRTKLAPEIFTEAKAGYLEGMFAGAGGQVLWRPTGKRWAIGADLYQVWQRDYDRLLELRDYNVLTGHASFYYDTPWQGINLKIHAGRYLAKDYGATFEVTRRFLTGVEIGAFATFTNVSYSKFGEGSFDKGILIRIPLGWAAPVHTQSNMNIDLKPITRDGGQRLIGDDSLYEETRRASYGEFVGHLDDVLRP